MSAPSNIHELITALGRKAQRLAPRAAEEALSSCNTNKRPIGPRAGLAWDLSALAFDLNYLSYEVQDADEALALVAERGSRYGAPAALVASVQQARKAQS